MTTIISENFIFIHIPKSAGTSISKAIIENKKVNKILEGHYPSQCFMSYNLPMVSVVRNPFARMVSLYEFLCNTNKATHARFDHTWMKNVGFKKWLLEGATYLATDPIDGRRYDLLTRTFKWLSDSPDDEIQKNYMKNGLPPLQQRPSEWWLHNCNNILKLETINDDISKNKFLKDLKGLIPIENKTTNKTKNWRSLYDKETIDFIYKFHISDIKKFNYDFIN